MQGFFSKMTIDTLEELSFFYFFHLNYLLLVFDI